MPGVCVGGVRAPDAHGLRARWSGDIEGELHFMSIQGFFVDLAAQSLPVLRAGDLRVVTGANRGDPAGPAASMILDDVYARRPEARTWQLCLRPDATGLAFRIERDSRIGRAGATVRLDCVATFMAPDATTVETLVLAELAPDGDVAATYLLPRADLAPRKEYTLVKLDRGDLGRDLAQRGCAAFVRGARVTMGDGRQRPIEALRPGEGILTRDNGVQRVRRTVLHTLPATGDSAPVLFEPGAVGNARVLRLSPRQRLFFYQREDRVRAGRAEVIVCAADLVNDTTIRPDPGGFVDYVSLVFDAPEYVFADGVTAECPGEGIGATAMPHPAVAYGRPEPHVLTPGRSHAALTAEMLRDASLA